MDDFCLDLREKSFIGTNKGKLKIISSLFSFMAFLSINLAILNLLPIPALDGGQLLILGVEGIIRRPLSLRQRLVWQQAGMAMLLVLMFFVLYNDVTRILR